MDNTLKPVVTRSCKSQHCHAPVHNRVDAVNNDNKSNYNRRDSTRSKGAEVKTWSGTNVVPSSTIGAENGTYSVVTGATELGSTDHRKERRHNRNDNNRQNNRNRFYYKLLLYLCTISTPVFAEDTNVSNPVAAATGNVTNQAVQFQNNGASSRQIYGPNIQCNGSTMTFSPFYMGNHSKPFDEFMQPSSYTLAENWGFQINFMVPLDKSGYKQCKEMAKRYEEKNETRV